MFVQLTVVQLDFFSLFKLNFFFFTVDVAVATTLQNILLIIYLCCLYVSLCVRLVYKIFEFHMFVR